MLQGPEETIFYSQNEIKIYKLHLENDIALLPSSSTQLSDRMFMMCVRLLLTWERLNVVGTGHDLSQNLIEKKDKYKWERKKEGQVKITRKQMQYDLPCTSIPSEKINNLMNLGSLRDGTLA